MALKNLTLLLAFMSYALLSESRGYNVTRNKIRKFPEGFLFGTATSAYQVEGAWDADGKSENIWDYMTHQNSSVTDDGENADIANDSYNKYKRDVEMLRELGVDVYRFSLSWTRILPTSFPDEINQAGVDYYNNLIDELLKYDITPIVTIYHWDLPQKLSLMGGWTNPHIVDWYADYARVVFDLFGDRVKHWITINEPREICIDGYGDELRAPRLNIQGYANYLCGKNVLVAHATAYHIYDKEFRHTQDGTIGISISARWYEPEDDDQASVAREVLEFEFGQYAHPIFSSAGGWPSIVKERVAAKSKEQGFKRSRLPDLTPEEVDFIRGTSDFFGLNHYSSDLVYRNSSVEGYYPVPSFYDDIEAILYQPSEWSGGVSWWLKDIPWGFNKLLAKIREDYNNPKVYVTENGYSTYGGLNDDDRIDYIRGYLNALLDAIEDGSNIKLYSVWSLMDNFEWMTGYKERFGLYEVDYSSSERTRTPRKSAFVYKEIVRSHELDPNYEPDTTVMTIDSKRKSRKRYGKNRHYRRNED